MKKIIAMVVTMVMVLSSLTVYAEVSDVESVMDEINSLINTIEVKNNSNNSIASEMSQLRECLNELDDVVLAEDKEVDVEVIKAILDAKKLFEESDSSLDNEYGSFTINEVKSNLGIKSVDFSDTTNHWSKGYLDLLVGLGSVGGYPDGTFKPDKTVSKAEFFKMAYSAGLGEDNLGGQGDHWAWGYFNDAYANGVVTENEFPQSEWNDSINRYEMTLIMVRVMEKVKGEASVSTSGVENAMADYNVVQANPYSYFVNQAYTKGLITGVDSNGTFGGSSLGTRAQAATMVARIIDEDYRQMPDISAPTVETSVEATGTTIKASAVTRTTVFRAGDTFVTASGQKVVLQMGTSGVVGEGQGLNLWESYVQADGTKIDDRELSSIEGHLGETFMFDQYGEAHHSSEWNDIKGTQINEASAKVRSGELNPTKGDSYGKWLVYGSFGWTWTGPIG